MLDPLVAYQAASADNQKFDAISLDCECWDDEEQDEDESIPILIGYINDLRDATGLPVGSFVSEYLLDNTALRPTFLFDGTTKQPGAHLMDNLDYAAVGAYRSKAATNVWGEGFLHIFEAWDDYKAANPDVADLVIGVETTDVETPIITFFSYSREYLEQELSTGINTYPVSRVSGTAVHSYRGWGDLRETMPAITITSLTPDTGGHVGGDAVTITGMNIGNRPTVTFGGVAATSIVRVSATSITCVTPAGAAGEVDVVIGNVDGVTATLADAFEYTDVFVFEDLWDELLLDPVSFNLSIVDDKVEYWADTSTNGTRDLEQGTAGSRPLYDASDAAYNDEPTMTFDGTDDFLRNWDWGTLNQPYTLLFVGEVGAAETGGFFATTTGGTTMAIANECPTVNCGTLLTGLADIGQKSIMLIEVNGASSKIYVNTVGSSTDGAAGAGVMSGQQAFFSLTGGTSPTAGKAAFVGIAGKVLSAGEKSGVLAYCADLWDVTVT